MIEGNALRTWLAAGITAITAGLVYLLTGEVQVALVTLAGVAATAVLVAALGAEGESGTLAADTAPSVPEPPLSEALEAIAEPVLVLGDRHVLHANAAARTLLGQHIEGEDSRLAIRHPAAADVLGSDDAARIETVELVGLGPRHEHWRMRVAPIAPGTRLAHLVDETGRHAAERMRVDFVANASHELRTPLASILGYVETLGDVESDDVATRARFLAIVMAEARRMQQLLDDLMSLSRIEAEKFRAPDRAVDLAALAEEVRQSLCQTQDPRAADVEMVTQDALPPVIGDSVQLSQLLHNLIGNAMKYGRAGTPVHVSLVRGSGDAVCLRVQDEGDGIAPEHLPRLTERFYRVDAGRSRAVGGTGLGLAIVKHIVERHRGRLDIASEPGRGTCVMVTLRAADASAAVTPSPAVITAS